MLGRDHRGWKHLPVTLGVVESGRLVRIVEPEWHGHSRARFCYDRYSPHIRPF